MVTDTREKANIEGWVIPRNREGRLVKVPPSESDQVSCPDDEKTFLDRRIEYYMKERERILQIRNTYSTSYRV